MSRLKTIVLLLLDIISLYAALAATVLIRYRGHDFSRYFADHLGPFSFVFLLWIIIFYLGDLYRNQALRSRHTFFRTLIPSLITANIISIILFYLFGGFFELTPKTNLFILSGVFLLIEYTWRTLLFETLRSQNEDVLLLGSSRLAQVTVEHLEKNPHTGYRIASWITNPQEMHLETLARLIKEKNIYLIIMEPELTKDARLIQTVYRLLPFGVQVINFSDFYEIIFEKAPLDELEEGWFLEHVATRRPLYDGAKRIIDFIIGTFAAVIFLPFAILSALAVLISSRGPIIYKQKRMGKDGRAFMLYKFRTMQNGGTGALWTEANDARITPVGKFLRSTHLDEIPQIMNILKGDISITGPRPERVELAEQYAQFPYYEIRHTVKPGLTGWAQINYKPSASLKEGYEKLWYDIYYIEHRSILLDILIILRTTKHFFKKGN